VHVQGIINEKSYTQCNSIAAAKCGTAMNTKTSEVSTGPGAESGIHDCLILQLLLVIVNAAFSVTVRVKCLQCFDTVGWAAGRASGL